MPPRRSGKGDDDGGATDRKRPSKSKDQERTARRTPLGVEERELEDGESDISSTVYSEDEETDVLGIPVYFQKRLGNKTVLVK